MENIQNPARQLTPAMTFIISESINRNGSPSIININPVNIRYLIRVILDSSFII